MILFLRALWEFVRPYRLRFFLGLVCGALYGATNGLLIAAVKVVVQLVFKGRRPLPDPYECFFSR